MRKMKRIAVSCTQIQTNMCLSPDCSCQAPQQWKSSSSSLFPLVFSVSNIAIRSLIPSLLCNLPSLFGGNILSNFKSHSTQRIQRERETKNKQAHWGFSPCYHILCLFFFLVHFSWGGDIPTVFIPSCPTNSSVFSKMGSKSYFYYKYL